MNAKNNEPEKVAPIYVSDLEGLELTLVQDSQDMEAVFDLIGLPAAERSEWGCLFVEVLDGEYGKIYAVEGSVPYLRSRVYQLK